MSERSKELDSSSSVFALVGSNPTECIFFLLLDTILIVITLHGMTIITANIQLETCPSDVEVGCGSFCLFGTLLLLYYVKSI